MPPALIPDDSDYESAEDSDFAPDAVPVDDEAAESSDDEVDAAPVKPKPSAKRKRGEEEAEDAGFENSGDEAIIERGLKRRRNKKKGKKNGGGGDVEIEGEGEGDEGGEGGLVKTRSMRAAEYVFFLDSRKNGCMLI